MPMVMELQKGGWHVAKPWLVPIIEWPENAAITRPATTGTSSPYAQNLGPKPLKVSGP